MAENEESDFINDIVKKDKKGNIVLDNASEAVADFINDIVKKDKKGNIVLDNASEAVSDTKKKFQPIVPYEVQEQENRDYARRLQEADTLEERQAIIKERTQKRLDRLTGKTRQEQIKQNLPSEKIVEQTPSKKVVLEEKIKQTETSVELDNKNIYNLKYIPKANTQKDKEYLWIPTVSEYVEYKKDQQLAIINAETAKKEIVTMEQIKYLYSPTATGFIREKKSAKYTTQGVQTTIVPIQNKTIEALPQKTQLRINASFKLHGKTFKVEGYSHVSKGNMDINNAREEANIRIRAKMVYMAQLMRDGYSEEDAYKAAVESPPIEKIDIDTPIPRDMEQTEEYSEEEIHYVTGE